MFSTITRQPKEEQIDLCRRVAAQITELTYGEAWANAEIVVDEGYESPYRFGRELREHVGDPNAPVFRFHTVEGKALYAVFAQDAVVYDPSQRQEAQRPPTIDYFEAVDQLSQ